MSFSLIAAPIEFSGGFLDLGSATIEGIRAGGAGVPGALVLDSEGHGAYPPGAVQAWGRGTAVERFLGFEISRTTAAFVLQSTHEVEVHIDWLGQTFEVNDEFSFPEGEDPTLDPAISIAVSLHGVLSNQPPRAQVSTPATVECTSPDGAIVELDGSATSDPDENIVRYIWRVDEARLDPTPALGIGATLAVLQAPYTTESYSLFVLDDKFAFGSTVTEVSVVDTTPPTIDEVDIGTDCLWPPNHKWVRFSLSDDVSARVEDECDPTAVLRVVSVVSSESPDAVGSGRTDPDVIIGETGFCVRSERTGAGGGRTYTVTLAADDRSGNVSTPAVVSIRVPRESSGCEARLDPSRFLSDAEAAEHCRFGDATRAPQPPPAPPRAIPQPEVETPGTRSAMAEASGLGGCALGGPETTATPWMLLLLTIVAISRRIRP